MIKIKSLASLVVALLLLSVMAIILIFYVEEDLPRLCETVTVTSDGVLEETLVVDALTINPGDKRECVIFLKSELDTDFDVTLKFEESFDGGLKPFIDVEIFSGDERVYIGVLAELLSGQAVEFNEDLSNQPTLLKIIYKMPVQTGDEAQNTTASFYIRLKIQKLTV